MVKSQIVNNDIIVDGICDFDPRHTFECGQCFRWRQLEDGLWQGVVRDRCVELQWRDNRLLIHDMDEKFFQTCLVSYLDLERNYAEIKEILSKGDPVMEKAIEFGHGIRLLKQDFHEAMLSFILSQNNGIPRIRQIVEKLCESFGAPIAYKGGMAYSFPDFAQVARLSIEALKPIKAGYRDSYLLKASGQALSRLVDYENFDKLDTGTVRTEMLKFCGVGPKVADCILLFSGIKYDIFPVDRWVKRVMAELYLDYEADTETLSRFAAEKFGKLAGFAQQYLFYYAREMKIGKVS